MSASPEPVAGERDAATPSHAAEQASPAMGAWPPVAVGVATLVVYLLTLRPEVQPGDSAELALAASEQGITHPPGYPLHTFLGWLFAQAFDDPARATRILSAACGSLAAALASAAALRITRSAFAAMAGGLILALAPPIWGAAVVTEVYSLNLALAALAVQLAIKWRGRMTTSRLLILSIAVGLALGGSPSNVLLIPGLIVLATGQAPANTKATRRPPQAWPAALVVTTATALLIHSWTYLRAGSYTPLGVTFLPDSPTNFIRYLAAEQYGRFGLQPWTFYPHRLGEHALAMFSNVAWVGAVLAAFGLVHIWRSDRRLGYGTALVFGLNFAYFTFHPWIDYQAMAVTSYLVVCLWIAAGIRPLLAAPDAGVRAESHSTPWRAMGTALPVVAILLLAILGWREQGERNRGKPVTEFVTTSLAAFPEKAIVASDWYRYAAMVYFQRVHGLRPDVILLERVDEPRVYTWGRVENWRQFLEEGSQRAATLTDLPFDPGSGGRPLEPLAPGWFCWADCPVAASPPATAR